MDGLGYVVDVEAPGQPAEVVQDQIHQVVPCRAPPLLLLVRFTDIVALGETGVAWATPRLCIDELRVERTGPEGIVCSCDNLGGTPTITLDPVTGEQTDGSRLDPFRPPDALS